ncbi:MAG: Asp-tRNA(Asn)/Glu-tRNA(Gln) amidotransferase subunit GatA [Myxococcaceae bacterium]|nr:Asp-tRNA(Asn)/Glu-tRNA(Gln) amidotransferase subunit GatA [Myxococcaceae bacterium]
MAAVTELTLSALSLELEAGRVSSVEATRGCLDRIAALDGQVKAFLAVDPAQALASAAASDARRAQGKRLGPLDGVPLGLKDLFCTTDFPTTAGSKILEGYRAPFDATVVARLRAAGAVFLGKQNLDQFGMGSSTEHSGAFPSHNPYALDRTPGGSSGGSAAALAARFCFGALGTDTGGSIRQPAALTNTVGLKPTYGRLSRSGVVAYASSLDCPGPMARTARDVAMLYQATAGADPDDSTSLRQALPPLTLDAGVKGLRIGLPAEYFGGGIEPEVEALVRACAQALERQGASLVPVSLPHTRFALPTYYLLACAEASSNLARYDGVRYGPRAAGATSLKDLYEKTRSAFFGDEVKRRLLLGTFALSAGYYDAYYRKAQRARTVIARDFTQAFGQVDLLLGPTSPAPAWRLGEKLEDPLRMYQMDALTLPASLAGLPAASVPAGFTAQGLPVGAQLIGPAFEEARVLQAAVALETAHPWHQKAPVL